MCLDRTGNLYPNIRNINRIKCLSFIFDTNDRHGDYTRIHPRKLKMFENLMFS